MTLCDPISIRKMYDRALMENKPLNVLLEVTHRCNLRCRHCYVVPEKERELSLQELKGIVDQLAEQGVLFLTVSGGEVLLRKDLFDLGAHARKKNFALRIFTNGTLIDEEAAERIASLTPLDVSVSLYGPDAESHEYVTRVPGSFEATLNALDLLSDHGITLRVKCTLMKHNAHLMQRIIEVAKAHGAIAQFDPLVTPKTDGDGSPVDLKIEDETLKGLISPDPARDNHGGLLCAAGRDMLSISPAGKVFPCVQLPVSLGDLRTQSFKEIWSESPALQELRSMRIWDLQPCEQCSDRENCRPCPGLNVLERGDWKRAAPLNCWVGHMRGRVASEAMSATERSSA